MREERDREYREQRKGRGVEDKGQWMYDSGEVHVERMMGSGRGREESRNEK